MTTRNASGEEGDGSPKGRKRDKVTEPKGRELICRTLQVWGGRGEFRMWSVIKVPHSTTAGIKKVLKTMESISKWRNLSKKILFGLLKPFHTHYSEQNDDDDDDDKEKRKGAQKRGRVKNNDVCYIYIYTRIHTLYCLNAEMITSVAPSPCVRWAATVCSRIA